MQSARLLLAGLPPMVARFFTDAAVAHAPTAVVVTLAATPDLLMEVARTAAEIVVVSVSEEEGAALAARLFRTSSVRVVIRLSTSGDRADLHSRDAPPRQAAALDAGELLDQALSLAVARERRPDGRS